MSDFVSQFLEQDDFDGQGDTFEEAVEDAWKKAKAHDKPPGWFKVKHEWVRVENPVREYKVIISPGSGP
ncbi:MAG: hypothetical protein ACRDOF_07100 [Gaiellaceae bacterium]